MAGCDVLVAVEWDDNAVATYRLNNPNTTIVHGDIGLLTVEKCLELAGLKEGELDIFDGSPPCQGFSLAGSRDMSDQRNYLFKEYVRLLTGLQPKAFIMENVRGMVVGKMKWVFAQILRELKGAGYRVKAQLMNAMYYGVPQSRERLIFIGIRDDLNIEPSFPAPQTRPIPLREAFAGLPVDSTVRLPRSVYVLWRQAKPGQSLAEVHERGSFFNCTKISPNKPSPTITKSSDKVLHWRYPRPLNTAELKRACSFPDCYKFAGTDSDAWERMGNSVPPLLMKAVAEHVIEILGGQE